MALVESGMLQEVWLERAENTSYIGNIYFGEVSRVLPGLQAAFMNMMTAKESCAGIFRYD